MTPQQLLDTLLRDCHTEQEFRHHLAVLQTFLEFVLFGHHADAPLSELFDAFFEKHEEAPEVVETVRARDEAFYRSFTAQNLYDVLKEVEKLLESLPSFTLYLPRELPRAEVAGIGKWLRREVHPKLVINAEVEPDLGAGCAFVWGGVYHDFSLRYFMRKHEQVLLEHIRTYDRAS